MNARVSLSNRRNEVNKKKKQSHWHISVLITSVSTSTFRKKKNKKNERWGKEVWLHVQTVLISNGESFVVVFFIARSSLTLLFVHSMEKLVFLCAELMCSRIVGDGYGFLVFHPCKQIQSTMKCNKMKSAVSQHSRLTWNSNWFVSVRGNEEEQKQRKKIPSGLLNWCILDRNRAKNPYRCPPSNEFAALYWWSVQPFFQRWIVL